MSLMTQISPIISKINNWRQFIHHDLNLTTSQKVVVMSVGVMGVSAVVIGVLTKFLSRKRAVPLQKSRSLLRQNAKRQQSVSERLSLASGSLASGSIGGGGPTGDTAGLTPQQLGVMGMEALETSINYWEDALAAFSTNAGVHGFLALTGPEEAEFSREIQELIEAAYLLQERSELLFLDQRSVLFRAESIAGSGAAAPVSLARSSDVTRARTVSHHSHRDITVECNHSSAESFASAQDEVADLREFDEFSDYFPDVDSLTLYQSALKQLESGIPYRTLRTEVVHCGSDAEFLCKLHCVRLAFQLMFKDPNVWLRFADTGRQMLTDLLLFADKDPKEFLVAYEEMLTWVSEDKNWQTIECELSAKGVKALTFYDVVLDYILLDAFEDLNSPPSTVTAVVQNRWLSNGFKETALTTAVWSVLKAKRRNLRGQYPDGFMAHFYAISEQMSPLLAWGFLGPDDTLRETCLYFKDQIIACLVDSFNFQKTRYTLVEELSEDIQKHIKYRIGNITQKLCSQG